MSETIGGIGKAVGAGVRTVGGALRAPMPRLAEVGPRLIKPSIEAPRLRLDSAKPAASVNTVYRPRTPESEVRIKSIREELANYEPEETPRILVVEKEEEKEGLLSSLLLAIAKLLIMAFKGGKDVVEVGKDAVEDPLTRQVFSAQFQ